MANDGMSTAHRQHTPVPPTTQPDSPAASASLSAASARGEGRLHASRRQRTRTSVAFNSLGGGAILLILLLVFILENTQRVKISYFGATGHISLGVALLVAAVGGAVLVGLAGTARVIQLRHRMKRTPS